MKYVSSLELENALWEFLAHIHKVNFKDRSTVVAEHASKIEALKSNQYLNEKQVAALWPALFSRRWLQEARRLKKGPKYYAMNRKIIYVKSDVESYIKTHLRCRNQDQK